MRTMALLASCGLLACGGDLGGDPNIGADSEDGTEQWGPMEELDPGVASPTVWRLLVLQADYDDDPGARYSEAELMDMGAKLGAFWSESSYGAVDLEVEVADVVRMPLTKAQTVDAKKGGTKHMTGLMGELMLATEEAGRPIDAFDLFLWMVHPEIKQGGNGFPTGVAWASYPTFGLTAMEMSHALNTKHANAWESSTDYPLGPGNPIEFGNPFDVMSNAYYGPDAHFNIRLKHYLGWLTDADLPVVQQSGVYTIQAQDMPRAGTAMGLRIPRDADTCFWIEARQLILSHVPEEESFDNPWVRDGVLVYLAPNDWNYIGHLTVQQSMLLDMTPGSLPTEFDFEDAPLLIGQSFTDEATGVTIAVLAEHATDPVTYDVEVFFDSPPPPFDSPPVVSIIEPSQPTTTYDGNGTDPIVFSAVAHDPDVGTQNGDGISEVVFRIFGTNKEQPALSSAAITSPPYQWSLDLNLLPPAAGLSLVVDAYAPGGQLGSSGQFFLVD